MKKERLEASSLETPQRGKSARSFWENASKEENYEKIRKGPATEVASITIALAPRGTEGRNQWYLRTSEQHYKRKKQPTLEGHSDIGKS